MRQLTFVFAAGLLIAYILLSTSLLYIPTSNLIAYGASFDNPIGFIAYSFVHVSPAHLIGNLILLIPIGFIAEKKLRSKDYIVIFFFSAAASAIVYSYMTPNHVLVGASSAISGLIAAGFMVDFKKGLLAVLLSSLLIYLVSPSITMYTQEHLGVLQNQSAQLEQNITQINQAIQVAIQQNNTQQAANFTEQKQAVVQDYSATKKSQTNIEVGVEREKTSTTSPIVHIVGALTGMAYLVAFRRDIIWEMPSQLISRKRSRRNSTKN